MDFCLLQCPGEAKSFKCHRIWYINCGKCHSAGCLQWHQSAVVTTIPSPKRQSLQKISTFSPETGFRLMVWAP